MSGIFVAHSSKSLDFSDATDNNVSNKARRSVDHIDGGRNDQDSRKTDSYRKTPKSRPSTDNELSNQFGDIIKLGKKLYFGIKQSKKNILTFFCPPLS